ncbi:MAG: DUF1553 domain-containing protein [Planctomycetes bacterium]|nr:DUF1553 domain-containing protein [Planctomycetota bacterium]
MRSLCHRRVWLPGALAIAGIALLGYHAGGRARRPGGRNLTAEQCAALYDREVRPLLASRCVRCHGSKRRAGGLRVDSIAAMREGGDSGPAIVPRNIEQSPLLSRVAEHDMPRGAPPLTRQETILLARWVHNGALGNDPEIKPAAEHWAFQPPRALTVPSIHDDEVYNPIDAFIARARARAGLTRHNPPAGRSLLLRRVAIDLTGLPPTADDYRHFLADRSADAYEKAVESLLASPRYAERWARHCMDVWRYSSHDGRKAPKQITYGSEHIWRWRDYLIRALLADAGLDRIIIDMLAGDEASPGDVHALAATGYLARSFNLLDRNLWLTNTVDHAGRAFLGLSLGCARCHDHKFDTISQREYYQFRAFFEPHEIVTDDAHRLAHARDGESQLTYVLSGGNPRLPNKHLTIEPGVPKALGVIEPPKRIDLPEDGERTSSGRRLALARWLVADDNPLTARVIVNHVWQRHFGRGLVETTDEFGVRGKPPSHPELLDWLAVHFRASGWSLKWLHRLIVTSATYRMSSSTRDMADARRADPDNRWHWRYTPRRMEAEAVRDGVLHLAGALDTAVGGPDETTELAESSLRRSLYLRASRVDRVAFLDIFDAPRVDECYRRTESIVPQQALALMNSTFAWRNAERIALSLPDSAWERIATKALPAERAASRGRASGVVRSRAEPDGVFLLILGRAGTDDELESCGEFLREQARLLCAAGASDPARRARIYLVHALLNHNDFVTVR